MEKEAILVEIEDCLIRCDAKNLLLNVEELLKVTTEEDASMELSQQLFTRYNTFRADAIAKLMETIIRKYPNLAMLGFPANYFFRLAIVRGSVDLYECYIEEVIEPFLVGKTEDEITECYLDLYSVAEKLTESFFPHYVRCVKGMDFNGTFSRYEKDNNIALIHQEDFEIMDDVVEKYNTILGRRDILIDLEKRYNVD
jgi:hypothetical protein